MTQDFDLHIQLPVVVKARYYKAQTQTKTHPEEKAGFVVEAVELFGIDLTDLLSASERQRIEDRIND